MTTLELTHVTKDNPILLSLFERAYHEILAPAFPDTNQAETLDKFMAAMHGQIPNFDVVVNLIGTQLRSTDKAELAGISIAYYYPEHNVGILAYNAISPDTRQGGLGKAMVQCRIDALKQKADERGRTLRAVFLEVNSPERAPAEYNTMDPHKRVAIFEKWGARKVGIDYIQPPVSVEGTFCDYMDLYSYPVDGRYADKSDVRDFLLASFSSGYGSPRAQNLALRSMFNDLRSWKPEQKLPRGACAGYQVGQPELQPVLM